MTPDAHLAVFQLDLQPFRLEGAAEDHLARALRDVDETAGTDDVLAQPRDVDVALRVQFAHAEEGDIDAAAAEEIELVVGFEDRARVARGAEEIAAEQFAVVRSLFDHGPADVHAFCVRHGGNAVGQAIAEVDARARRKLLSGALRDEVADARGQRRRRARVGRGQLAADGRVVARGGGLLLGGVHADVVDEHARHRDRARRRDRRGRDVAHLREHAAAAVVRGERGGERVDIGGFFTRCQVALHIRRGAAHDREVDREGLVPEQFLAAERDDIDEIIARTGVDAAAAVARIGEGIEADVGDETVTARAGFANQRLDHAGRQRVSLDAFLARELLHRLRPGPVAADDALHHAFVRETADAARHAVADAERVDQREIARMARRQKAPLDGLGDVIGLDQSAARAAQHDGRAIENRRRHEIRIRQICTFHLICPRYARPRGPSAH